jgi:hypothetical protein
MNSASVSSTAKELGNISLVTQARAMVLGVDC